MARFQNILETVGHTPVVRINRLAPEGINLHVKIEAFNPLGSVKDRLALGVIEAAEQSGELKPGQTVVETSFKPHPMQGWTPDFIPKLTGDAVDMKLIDRILPISGADAIRYSKELAAKEGIFVGITSGGTFASALKIAAEAPKGANILCMLPDTGERYLSTPLFADVPVDMTEEELAILRSIPGA
jgi:cysteine synthase